MIARQAAALFTAIVTVTATSTATNPAAAQTTQPAATHHAAPHADAPTANRVVADHAALVHTSYHDAHRDAVRMRNAIDTFLDDPTPATLERAKRAWLAARESYGLTEAFRFYEGPIDFVDPDANAEGPEGMLNAWPLNEAYIDHVEGRPDAGIIHDADVPITAAALTDRNAKDDEANVTTGYHAIEFLLWGQDFDDHAAGRRPVDDYLGDDESTARRRAYLRVVTDLLVDQLATLVDAWAPGRDDNYRATFTAAPADESLGHILTGLATLSGFELASERLGVPLDSGDQEDEHSCFSDNTHRDIVQNVAGIHDVWFARRGAFEGASLSRLLAARDADLASRIDQQVRESLERAQAIDPPVDAILASPPGSDSRRRVEALIDSLIQQAQLLQQAGDTLGVQVIIAAE